ncbi:MAG: nucleotidyltransferase domain-containing protein [Nanoarchaeota archaeon]
MLHIKDNKKKVLELFFDNPTEQFYLRQISRKTKIAVTSVRKYLNELLSEKMIIKINKWIYPSFKANRDSDDGIFKFYKKLNIIERIYSSGLLDYLEDKCMPNSIILFGSASLGEDIENSDIDIFVESDEKKLLLDEFNKKLNRKINIFFEKDFSRLNKELKNNISNGIKLRGYLKIF